jgi:hypothetical protein
MNLFACNFRRLTFDGNEYWGLLKVVYILYRNWTRVGHGFVNSFIQFMGWTWVRQLEIHSIHRDNDQDISWLIVELLSSRHRYNVQDISWLIVELLSSRHRDNVQDISQMCEWLIVEMPSSRHRDNDQDLSHMCEWLIVEMPKSKACVGSECLAAIHSYMNELFCFLSRSNWRGLRFFVELSFFSSL